MSLYCSRSKYVLNKLLKDSYISLSISSQSNLMYGFLQTIHNELLLHYHSKKLLVEEGICQLIDVLEKSDNEATKFHKNAPSKTDIVSFV